MALHQLVALILLFQVSRSRCQQGCLGLPGRPKRKSLNECSPGLAYHCLACRWAAPLLPAIAAAPSTAPVSTGRCRKRDRRGRLRHGFRQLTHHARREHTRPSKHSENLLVSSWSEEQRQHSHLRRGDFSPAAWQMTEHTVCRADAAVLHTLGCFM